MADILYTYKNQVYANITNLCDCRCEFCIRSHEDGVGDAETLWHKKDPSLEEIIAANRPAAVIFNVLFLMCPTLLN